jgi:hypothetical protein
VVYSDFTVRKVKQTFGITTIEDASFFPNLEQKADLNAGMGQCMADMIAAQRFNLEAGREPAPVYGCVSSGTLWRFLRLTDQQVEIDVESYLLTPIDRLLGRLIWMARS